MGESRTLLGRGGRWGTAESLQSLLVGGEGGNESAMQQAEEFFFVHVWVSESEASLGANGFPNPAAGVPEQGSNA